MDNEFCKVSNDVLAVPEIKLAKRVFLPPPIKLGDVVQTDR